MQEITVFLLSEGWGEPPEVTASHRLTELWSLLEIIQVLLQDIYVYKKVS